MEIRAPRDCYEMQAHTFVCLFRQAVHALIVTALRNALFFVSNSSLRTGTRSRIGLGDILTAKGKLSDCEVLELSREGVIKIDGIIHSS